MSTYQWHTFVRKIHIHAPMQQVYDAWSTSEGICSWFLRVCDLIQTYGTLRSPTEAAEAGDTYAWEWYNWEAREEGKILEANGKDRISFTFGEGPIVIIELSQDRGMTLLNLTQKDMPTDDESKMMLYYGCGTGWTFWLTNLKIWLEHGILVNDRSNEFVGQHDGFEFVNM